MSIEEKAVITAERVLAKLPPEQLRPILSRLANATPNVCYWPENWLKDFPDKHAEDGRKMSRMEEAAMFMANAAANHLAPGDTAEMRLGGISHGEVNNGDFIVTVKRVTDMHEGDTAPVPDIPQTLRPGLYRMSYLVKVLQDVEVLEEDAGDIADAEGKPLSAVTPTDVLSHAAMEDFDWIELSVHSILSATPHDATPGEPV